MKLIKDIFFTNEMIEGSIIVNETEIPFKCLFAPDELEYIRENGGDSWLEIHARNIILRSELFESLLDKCKYELRKTVMKRINEKMVEIKRSGGE